MELIIAREVICDWNARHGFEQKQILLPLYGEGARDSLSTDLLVAFFCASQGKPSDHTARDTGTDIEKQLQAGRPALIYFSEARNDFAGINELQEQELSEYKKRYAWRATIDSYGDEKEFRAKFARQLETMVGTHGQFKADALIPSAVPTSKPEPIVARELSKCAQTLLSEACEDFEAYIGRIKLGNTLKIQANGKQLVNQNDPDAAVMWDAAFQELLSGGFIRESGCNGQLFQISSKGFDFLKSIGKTPVGEIGYLGGM